jgi:hypothetical protein
VSSGWLNKQTAAAAVQARSALKGIPGGNQIKQAAVPRCGCEQDGSGHAWGCRFDTVSAVGEPESDPRPTQQRTGAPPPSAAPSTTSDTSMKPNTVVDDDGSPPPTAAIDIEPPKPPKLSTSTGPLDRFFVRTGT